MATDVSSDIGRALRSGDRLSAVGDLSKVSSIGAEFAETIVEDLVYALENESGTYTRLQLIKEIKRVAESHPQMAASVVKPVVIQINSILAEYDGNEPSENREVALGTDILELVLNGTDCSELTLDIAYRELRNVVEQGNARQRGLCYRLMGRTATGEAVRILLRDFSHEVDSVREDRRAGLEDLRELVFGALDGTGNISVTDAVISFTELYAEDYINPTREQVELTRKGLSDAVMSTEGELQEEALSAVERLVRRDEIAAEAIVSETFERLRAESEYSADPWLILKACASGAPATLLAHGEALTKEFDETGSADSISALEVVFIAAQKMTSVPAVLADPVLSLVDTPNEDVATTAIKTAGAMGFYPVPRPLEALVDSENPTLSRAASDAMDRLQQNEPEPGFVSSIASGDSSVSLFAGDSGSLHLKYRSDGGRWIDLDVGEIRKGIVEEAVRQLEEGEEPADVVYPYYEPRDVVILALAIILDSPAADRQVGLYSPGSQTQWGNKGEVREELRKFALSDVAGDVVSATPIPSIIPESYVWDGEVKANSDGQGPGGILLTKKIPEMEHLEDLDVALLNNTSRKPLEIQDSIDELQVSHPASKFVHTSSYYTRNDTEGRPRYGPPTEIESAGRIPSADLVDPVITRDEEAASGGHESQTTSGLATSSSKGEPASGDTPWKLGDDDVRAFSQSSTIRLEHVESGPVAKLFDQLFEESAGLRDTEDAGAGGLIFSRHLFFERLSIPADDYDDWVRARYAEGDRFVPPLIQERINDVERKAGTVEHLEAVQPLNKSKQILERVHAILREENPLFEELREYISEAKQSDERLAIFSESPKNAQLVRDTLAKYDLVSEAESGSDRVNVVSPNQARKMGSYDKLVICGPLHPENAGFYVHPRIEETVILTYDRSWATMIGRHATEFVDLLNGSVGGSDYSPFEEPELVGDIDEENVETTEELEEETTVTPTASGDADESKASVLEDVMRSASLTEYEDEPEGSDRELRHYFIETEAGEEIDLNNHESILIRAASSGDDEFHWVNPDLLSGGETIVTIPDEIEEELWQEQLRELYENEVDADRATEIVRTWYDSLNEIWDRVRGELRGGSDMSDGEIHTAIYEWIDREVDEFDRVPMTVRQWFESARDADSPMDLAQNPTLILGPRSYRDIQAVGIAFGYDELENDAEEIEKAMRGLRSINQREGHKHRDSIRDQLNSGEETRVSEVASLHRVATIRQGDDEPDEKSGAGENTHGLDDDLVDRVLELVELAPTKNSELAEAWGFSSGSDLYQFMSSDLDGYHERNDEKLIVPTEKAKELASEVSGK